MECRVLMIERSSLVAQAAVQLLAYLQESAHAGGIRVDLQLLDRHILDPAPQTLEHLWRRQRMSIFNSAVLAQCWRSSRDNMMVL